MPLRAGATGLFVLIAVANEAIGAPSAITPLDAATRAVMTGKAWNPGCPVSLDDLVAVRLTYLGFDGVDHQGVIVIHKRLAGDIVEIFKELHAARFPIRNLSPYENYEVGKSAYSDATVGFYCRRAQDAPTEWSGHAYGAAIDINPQENPFLDAKDGWWPPGSAPMAARDEAKGKASPSSEAFRIFTRHGWAWGGFYAGEPDYMHFYKLTVGSGTPLQRHYVVKSMDYVPDAVSKAPPASPQ